MIMSKELIIDEILLKYFDFVGIVLITIGIYLMLSFPNSIELIKLATIKEIVSGVSGLLLFLLGGWTYVFSEIMFIKKVKK